jgi:hypothetical protein
MLKNKAKRVLGAGMPEFGGGRVILNRMVSAKKALCGGALAFVSIHRTSCFRSKMPTAAKSRV